MPRFRNRRGPPPTFLQLVSVGNDVIDALNSLGIDACFFGGMGCKLFGTGRLPNDLDVICLTKLWDAEDLKRTLTRQNSNFYLVPSRNPDATYKVLWYRIVNTDTRVKVDLLFPGVMDIPEFSASDIDWSNRHRLPCCPLSALLLLKLQGWIHHSEEEEARFRAKQVADVRDINELLVIACRKQIQPREESYLDGEFILSAAEERLEAYLEEYPHTHDRWEQLGLM